MDDTANDGPAASAAIRVSPWTCPFCSLLCDGFGISTGASPQLTGSDCPRAREGLSHFSATPSSALPLIDGHSATFGEAIEGAAEILAETHAPLFGGMATDVAGARALFRLAALTGAIVDHAHGDAMMHALRSIQDRGVFYTTLAEIRTRGDLIVCIGTTPSEHYPEFFRRCDIGQPTTSKSFERRVVFVGAPSDPTIGTHRSVSTNEVGLSGDLFDTLAMLNALCAERRFREAPEDLEALARQFFAARYIVFVWEPARLPEDGALIAESINQLVRTLNRTTRAASFALGGSEGAYATNQVLTWLCGLPIRTALRRHGLDHEPIRYATEHALRDASLDVLVWVSSFGPRPAAPRSDLPCVILGHPAHGEALESRPAKTVFIPVSTPGVGSAGHLFRVDGGVALPLAPIYQDSLRTVAEVADNIMRCLAARGHARGAQAL